MLACNHAVPVPECPECLWREAAGLVADLDACEASAASEAWGTATAVLAEIRRLLADKHLRREIQSQAREWDSAVRGHEMICAKFPVGSTVRVAQEERASEARKHRDLYRALLRLCEGSG